MIQLTDAVENNSSISGLVSDINLFSNELQIIWNIVDSITTSIESSKIIVAENIRQINNGFNTNKQIEQNERDVNDIFLSTIAKGIFEFSIVQKNTLEGIIYQCPLAGGNAVIIARALYAFINYNKRYDDRTICNLQNIELKQTASSDVQSKFSLHPNPANTLVTLSYNIEHSQSAKMVLLNTMGQVIQNYNLNVHDRNFVFSVENLNPGVYYVKTQINNSVADAIKLVIVR
jgi:hypothetical protein